MPAKGTGARPRGGAAPWWVRQSKRGTGLTPAGEDASLYGVMSDDDVLAGDSRAIDAENWQNMTPAQQRDALDRIGKAAGKDDASTSRMITDLVGRGFAVVQQYLHDRVGVEIAQITADSRVAIARIGARGGLTSDPSGGTPPGPQSRGQVQPVTIASDGGGGTALVLAAVAGLALMSKGGRGRR